MWNRPQLMKAVADLLIAAAVAALLAAAAIWVTRLPLLPIREVAVMNELKAVQRGDIEDSLVDYLHGGFFAVDLEKVRVSLERLAWVRHAEVRRQWPANIEIRIEEQVPVAYWGQDTGRLVNSYGEIFTARMRGTGSESMPVLNGPDGFVPEMLGYFQQAVELLKPIGRWPQVLNVSPRLALQLKLDDGMVVELGRQQAKAPIRERMERFVTYYPTLLNAAKKPPNVVDMRYPQGFALRIAAAPETEIKGKP